MSLPVFLRRARAADAAALAALERAVSPHPWSEALLLAELERPAPDEVLALEGRAGLEAYCACRLVLDEAHVMGLGVRPAARRRGLGRFLLSVVLARAARAGATRALLEVRSGNSAALSLYAQFGFVAIGRRKQYYTDPIDDAIVLAREGLQSRNQSILN